MDTSIILQSQLYLKGKKYLEIALGIEGTPILYLRGDQDFQHFREGGGHFSQKGKMLKKQHFCLQCPFHKAIKYIKIIHDTFS